MKNGADDCKVEHTTKWLETLTIGLGKYAIRNNRKEIINSKKRGFMQNHIF